MITYNYKHIVDLLCEKIGKCSECPITICECCAKDDLVKSLEEAYPNGYKIEDDSDIVAMICGSVPEKYGCSDCILYHKCNCCSDNLPSII